MRRDHDVKTGGEDECVCVCVWKNRKRRIIRIARYADSRRGSSYFAGSFRTFPGERERGRGGGVKKQV